jgi:hypothetical protein
LGWFLSDLSCKKARKGSTSQWLGTSPNHSTPDGLVFGFGDFLVVGI